MTAPDTVSIKEAAESIDVHPNTIRNYLAKQYLGYVRLPSGQRRVLKADLDRLRQEMFIGPPFQVDDFDRGQVWAEDPKGTESLPYIE